MSGVKVKLPSHADLASGVSSPDTSDDTKGNTFLETPDPLRFWNGLADPDASTRRLYTNVLYVSLLDVINMRLIFCDLSGTDVTNSLDSANFHREDS